LPRLDLVKAGRLDFQEPDRGRFPCLGLAYRALRAGGTAPVVLNAANEVAVASFLEGHLGFTSIPVVIDRTLNAHESDSVSTSAPPQAGPVGIELIRRVDAWAREYAGALAARPQPRYN